MPEVATINPSQPEARERILRIREVALNFGEYYAIYFTGRHDPDKPHDRLTKRTELMNGFPEFASLIKRLDEDLENARGITEGFDSFPLPRQDEVEELKPLPPQIRKIIHGIYGKGSSGDNRQTSGSPIPPDYTFSGVRHPIARDLLENLNVASLDLESINDPRERSNVLKTNGEKMLQQILGENYDPHSVVRLQLTEVLTAVFDGRVKLPSIKTPAPITEIESSLVEGISNG